MRRTLIVARMDAASADAVAGLFAASDATRLPHLIGVSRRTLFRFHDLYFHLVESGDDLAERLRLARDGALYQDLDARLREHIRPYDPGWREPGDAMAVPFYTWEPGG
ncbi:TcmI family type II polyketide cyclase [Nonomuraea monospora]|uniref:TcmI family type II polyketide cyclase n=1 Tax=Nonomuraea monospora TaxID=568818 RepID=A0ABN3C5F2_9ACTN